MATWIKSTMITGGINQMSNCSAVMACSGQPATWADAQSGGSCFLASIPFMSFLASTTASNAITGSFGTTSYASGVTSGMCNHLAFVGSNSTLFFVVSLATTVSIVTTKSYNAVACGVKIGPIA